ncbi:hypothetical protein PVBG_05614 [Plasmodium vivax Brazil I]|uniref:VIR protein n=1 Tax=Plasmodium vivax (strain Brazil I) TaxID=1033975 RepID=A0A0J9VNS6_PLAV1|nr:hypothetical protein PVBG_05614 [Plasmodium vivax Brazil I]
MSMGRSPINRTLIGRYQQLYSGGCTNNFFEFKNKIEEEITELDKKQPPDFCQKCFKLRTTITKKDTEFRTCSTGQSNQLKLIEIHDIKDFINKCPTVHKCLQKLSPPNKKPAAAKQGSETNCVKNKGCEPKVPSTASQTARQSPRLASKPPSTRITEGQKTQNISRQLDNREISRAGGPGLQMQQNLHPKLENQVHIHLVIHHKRALIKTLNQGSGGSAPREQTPAGEPIRNQAHNDQSVTTGTSDGSTHAQIPPVNGQKVEENFILDPVNGAGTEDTPVDGADTHSVDINRSASGDTTTSTMVRNGEPFIDAHVDGGDANLSITRSTGDDIQVPNSKASDGEESNHGDTRTEGSKNKAAVGGDTDNKNLCIGVTDNQSSNNGNRCSNGQGSELMDNNTNALGIFSNIFGVIQANKDNVINTSIPVGIVLLLGLLFKVN